ncbi:TolC family protein [Pontibacter sp. HSC-14F20]|uniref:TolC family protein n=1 Tax=Pontibacter sp. HSC-14F20 TaxID=2864136 RepID=UPI001C73D32B|nr:TolC family protein [Pontibacter sp. HSC-14F20]MBX0333894.1 TolC family protein [Pontibacter sp. HSC-14F20]
MKKYSSLLLILFVLLSPLGVLAQGTPQAFSLQQGIDYALQNRASLKIARNQQDIDKAKVGEIRAMGLPQINANAEVGNNFIQQKTLFDPSSFGGAPSVLDPFVITPEQLASGQPIVLNPIYSQPEPPTSGGLQAISFVQPYNGSLTVTGSQLLFDGSYLIGLKAAKTYTDLARKTTEQNEIDVVEQVTKAYYSVLVSRERMELLNQNLTRLDTLLNQTQVMFDNGVAEKLDVDRLRVTYNNLNVEKQKTERLLILGEYLLKFQMGMPQKEQLVLTDSLSEVQVDMAKATRNGFNYSNRIEYSVLETQRDLALLNLRNIRSGYLPKLYLNARYGYNGVGSTFSDVMNIRAGQDNTTDRNYFDFGYVGLQLQVPIFDGLRKHYQIQQSRLTLENAKLGFESLEQGIDLELEQASTDLTNSLDVLASQRENLELAEEIARVSKIKFQEGVGSNLEVVTAETDLRQAQTNYYAAMYDALIAKVNLDKATGTLLTK